MKLFILGNGFDVYHGLATTVEDFKKLIEYRDVDEYYLCAGADWNKYEEALSNLDMNEIAERFVGFPDYTSDHEYDRDGVITNMEEHMTKMYGVVVAALNDMVSNAEKEIESLRKSSSFTHIGDKTFADDSIIVSFNYTSTLEKLYSQNMQRRILHIHGYQLNGDNLVFGYSDPSESVLRLFHNYYVSLPGFETIEYDENYGLDPYEQKQYEEMCRFYLSNRKCHRIDELKEWVSPFVGRIDEIIVLGHSMGIVDKPYFDFVEEILAPQKWVISQFNNSPSQEHIQQYSFADRIKFCTISDYL